MGYLGLLGALVLLWLGEFDLASIFGSVLLLILVTTLFFDRINIVLSGGIYIVGSLIIYYTTVSETQPFYWTLIGAGAALLWGLLLQKRDKKTREEVRFRRRLFSDIFNNSPEAIILMDYYSKKIEDCNEVTVRMFDLEHKESIIGDHGHSFVLPVLSEEEFLECRKEISVKGAWTKKVKQKTIKGRKFDAEMHITPLKVEKKNYYVIRIKDITEKLKTEKSLEESTEKLANVLESIDSIVYNISINDDGSKELNYISKKIEDVFGLSVEDFKELSKSNKILEFYHPDDIEAIKKESRKLREEKKPVALQYRFLHQKLNTYIWMEEKVFPKLSADGKHIANFGITTNIHNRKQYEEAIKASEKRYRNLFERNLAGVYMVNIEEKVIVDCNDSFAKILGFESRDKVIGNKTTDLYKESGALKDFYSQILEKKQVFNRESEVMLKSGDSIWILENASVIEEENNPVFVEGTILDITELKEIQKAYIESEEKLSNVITTIDDLVYNVKVDEKGNKDFRFMSPQIESLIGYTKEEYLDMARTGEITTYFHPDDLDRVKKNATIINEKGKPSTVVYRFKHGKTGEYKWLEESTYPQVEKDRVVAQMGIIRDVTQRVEYENKIKESEERFRTLFERNLAGVFRSNPDGQIVECNDAFAQIFGHSTKDKIQGRPARELYFSEKDRNDYIKELKKSGYLSNYEMKLRRRDDSVIWVLANVALTPTPQGDEYIEGTLIDITELKITSEALIESESRFKLLAESTLEGIVITDDYKIIDLNDQFVHLLGYDSPDELLGESLEKVIAPDFRDTVKERITRNTGEAYEGRAIKKDGTVITVETTGKQIPYGGKTVRVSVIYDITNRKRAEEELKERERTLSTLLGNLPGMVYRCANDEDWTMEFCSEGAKELLGYTPRELMEERLENYNNLILPEDRDLVRDKVDEAVEKKSPYVIEYRIQSRDKTEKWVWEQGEAVFNQDGEVAALEGFIMDVTDRKKSEHRLKINEENFRNIAEHSPNAILILIDKKVEYANPAAYDIFNPEKEKGLLDVSIEKLFSKESRNKIEQSLKDAQKGVDSGPQEVEGTRSNGDSVSLAMQQVPTSYHEKEAVYMILQNLEVQRQLAKEQTRAQIAEDVNKRLEKEVAEHKKTQEKLREAERFTRNIFDSSLDMILASNNDNQITEMNKASLEKFGYTKEELYGVSPAILYADKEKYKEVRKSIDETGLYTGETLNITKNGHVFPSYLSASLIRNENGEIVGTMGVSRDISELKAAETQAKISEERYRDLFDNANDLIQSVGPDHKLLYVNTSWKQTMKYSQKEIESMKVEEFVHPEDREGFKEVLDDAFAGKEVDSIDMRMVSKTGAEINLEGSVTVRLDKGEATSVRMILRNITEEKKAERLVMEQSSKIRSIFESTADIMIWTLDSDFRITSFNNKFENTLREMLDVEVRIGDDFYKLIEPFMRKDLRGSYKRFVRRSFKGKPQQFEGPLADKDGNVVWGEQFLSPIKLEDGSIQEIACLAHEITEKKLTEKRIRDSLKEKEVLLKEVHHRVKNNLQVISSILNLQSSYVKDENTLSILKESQNRIKSMSFIHESLYQNKDFSQINFSDYIINLSNNLVHSYQLYGDLVDLRHEIDEVHLNLDQAIPCGLIINELVSNALKYAFTADEKGTLFIGVKEQGGEVQIRVEDDGVGLPKDFEMKNTETLGLQLVITLVEQLDGRLHVESKSGTQYLITFEKQN